MSKYSGVVSRGIKLPIIKEGDSLEDIIVKTLLEAQDSGEFILQDRDVVAITESIVARSQGNYATVDDIANDIKGKIGENKTICLMYPILSRNRFSIILKGIARAAKKVVLILSYPSDEVGNSLISWDQIDSYNIKPEERIMGLNEYRYFFGDNKHEFTGIDYVSYYKSLIEGEGAQCDIFFSNKTGYFGSMGFDAYIAADIHTRNRTKKLLKKSGADTVFGLDDILTIPDTKHGYNTTYGVLGSNKASEDVIKLFPSTAESQKLVENIQRVIFEKTGKEIEVMVYGDGAFKDPKGKIWELADPVVSPAYTSGLKGRPNELKLKYLADDKFKKLKGKKLAKAIKEEIIKKDKDLKGNMASEGTTPRQLTDLLGSLADLTSGSGDKGTPVVLIQNYFNNYSNE